jgi:heat shock protein HtpX
MNQPSITFSRTAILFETILSLVALTGLLTLIGFLLLGVNGLVVGPFALINLLLFEVSIPIAWLQRLFRLSSIPAYHPLTKMFESLRHQSGIEHPVYLFHSPRQEINAFSMGRGSQSAIVLTEPIIRQFTVQELAGIMAHELSHIKNKDIRYMSLSTGLTNMIAQLCFVLLIFSLISFPVQMMQGTSHMSLFMFSAALILPNLAFKLNARLSRTREYAADLGASEILGTPDYLISALTKLENYRSWFSLLWIHRNPAFESHPATLERIRRLRSYRR